MELHAGASQWERWSLWGRERRGEVGRGEQAGKNKEVARLRRQEGRKGRQAFMKFYQKYSSFTLHKRKAQKNTIPSGQRGQAVTGGFKIAEVLMCIFTSVFTKRCYILLSGLWVTLRKQPQADVLSDLLSAPPWLVNIGFLCIFLCL